MLEELRRKLKAKREEARSLNEAGKVEEAGKALEEARSLKKQIEQQEEIEEAEKRSLEQKKKKEEEARKANEKVNEMRALTKFVLHKEMSDEERAVVKTTDNLAVLPGQFINELETYRKGFAPLKGDCDVIPVNTLTGSKPTFDAEQNGKLKDIVEGDAIADGSLETSKIDFSVKKIGIKVPFSSEVLEDAQIDLETACRSTFAESSVLTENYNIIQVIDKAATAYAGTETDYTAIETAIAQQKPAVRAGLKVYVNEEMYATLKTAKDKQGRSLNLITIGQNGQEMFEGICPIREFDSSFITFTESDTKKKLAYVCNPREAVKFFDRKQTTVQKWYDGDTDQWKLSVLERADIKAGNKRSVVKIAQE